MEYAFRSVGENTAYDDMITIDLSTIYQGTTKLSDLDMYEAKALESAREGDEVVLTGAAPVWLYLKIAHALHGKAKRLIRMVSLGLPDPTSRLAPDGDQEWEKKGTEHRRQYVGGIRGMCLGRGAGRACEAEMKHVSPVLLDEITRRLVNEFQPERIILFGSACLGRTDRGQRPGPLGDRS